MSWFRLIHFLDDGGKSCYGEPEIEDVTHLLESASNGDLYAQELVGNDPFSLVRGSRRLHVKEIVDILRPSDVPIIRCVGLNYLKHIKEGGRSPPPHPSIFIKPATSVAGFRENIPVPKIAQDSLDYEGELSIVIGKDGKDICREDALDYVAGYVASNDVSCRPVLVSPKVLEAAGHLRLQTLVNGEVRQDSNTDDLLFDVPHIIGFLSQGTTLEKGTVIMTGTPAGVGMGMKPSPKYLKDGDVVEVIIEGLGSTKNVMKFE
ncbi:Ureidoglycolate lyase [Pleurostoma richardsiae]|uniref:Ureidoglycolate lyase n=1 Tax=Pleurostoma richardsiae TaxID=41990 RepID=A0AA38RJP3_9PEZI|nr:Ureidoglycolate lyase [Pleurostoma richardsiae]